MHITILMVLTYIACCVRIATAPWKYFQLNARYFSTEQGIFSKIAIDRLIPARWRLYQDYDVDGLVPDRFPVFLKPEWGQNAHGIHRADNPTELNRLRTRLHAEPQRYILQEAAPGQREFEVFSIDAYGAQRPAAAGEQLLAADVVTVTEAVNGCESYPINSKYNRDTHYTDITHNFSREELGRLAACLRRIGRFGIARMSARADSREALLAGEFHIIEINLFLPMPINLLDADYSWRRKWRFIRHAMMSLALATRAITPMDRPPAVFTRMMLYGRRRQSQQTAPIGQVSTRRSVL